MSRTHAVAVAVLLAVAGAVGLFGLARTLGVGRSAAAARVPDALVAKRSRALDRFEISLRRQLAKQPPRLPAVPKFAPVKVPAAPAATAPAAATTPAAAPVAAASPRVVYVRPAPVIIHRSHHGDESDHGDDGGDEGGGGD